MGVVQKVKKTCPRIRFVRENMDGHAAIKAYAAGGRRVGLVTIKNKITIGFIDVHPGMQRCGLGTRLYEKAAKIACAEAKAPLNSDMERTAASQGFWEKQVRKGRAHCAMPADPAFVSKGADGESVYGRGDCDHYVLKCPAPASLAGKRSPRSRRR